MQNTTMQATMMNVTTMMKTLVDDAQANAAFADIAGAPPARLQGSRIRKANRSWTRWM